MCIRDRADAVWRQYAATGGGDHGFSRVVKAEPPATCKNTRCLLYTSDAADERSRVDLGGRRILKKKTRNKKKKTKHTVTRVPATRRLATTTERE